LDRSTDHDPKNRYSTLAPELVAGNRSGLGGPDVEFADAAPVPEPTSIVLLGSGLLGPLGLRQRRN
jgi:hypothetical protein